MCVCVREREWEWAWRLGGEGAHAVEHGSELPALVLARPRHRHVHLHSIRSLLFIINKLQTGFGLKFIVHYILLIRRAS